MMIPMDSRGSTSPSPSPSPSPIKGQRSGSGSGGLGQVGQGDAARPSSPTSTLRTVIKVKSRPSVPARLEEARQCLYIAQYTLAAEMEHVGYVGAVVKR